MSVIENFAKFLPVTGPQYGHIAWWLAQQDWPTDAHRDEFIAALTGQIGGPNAGR